MTIHKTPDLFTGGVGFKHLSKLQMYW